MNTFGTNWIVILVYSVDRDRLRERERQARAAMSIQAEQAAAGGGSEIPSRHHHNHHNTHSNIHVSPPNLFRAPVRVNIFSIYSFSTIGEIVFFRYIYVSTICLYGDIDYPFLQILGEHLLVQKKRVIDTLSFSLLSIYWKFRVVLFVIVHHYYWCLYIDFYVTNIFLIQLRVID